MQLARADAQRGTATVFRVVRWISTIKDPIRRLMRQQDVHTLWYFPISSLRTAVRNPVELQSEMRNCTFDQCAIQVPLDPRLIIMVASHEQLDWVRASLKPAPKLTQVITTKCVFEGCVSTVNEHVTFWHSEVAMKAMSVAHDDNANKLFSLLEEA